MEELVEDLARLHGWRRRIVLPGLFQFTPQGSRSFQNGLGGRRQYFKGILGGPTAHFFMDLAGLIDAQLRLARIHLAEAVRPGGVRQKRVYFDRQIRFLSQRNLADRLVANKKAFRTFAGHLKIELNREVFHEYDLRLNAGQPSSSSGIRMAHPVFWLSEDGKTVHLMVGSVMPMRRDSQLDADFLG